LKILILKPSSLGDVIQALPVLRLLKLHWPESEIHWWIDSSLAPLLEGDRDLAGIVRFERRRWASPQHWPEMFHSVQWMRAQNFDLVIDLQCLARSGAFAWLANGKTLVGLDEIREGARGFYDIAVRRASWHTHAVDWYLAVAKAIGLDPGRAVDWLPENRAVAAEVRRKWRIDGARWVVLCPGARWENKMWPLKSFVELSHRLLQEHADLKLVVIGGREDMGRGRVLHSADPDRVLDLTGCTSLTEMVEWIRLAEVTVTNDTGPMHVAAALKKPVVAIFGPTAPERTGPYGQIDRVLRASLPCIPCLQRRCHFEEALACLHRIKPEQAVRQSSLFLA